MDAAEERDGAGLEENPSVTGIAAPAGLLDGRGLVTIDSSTRAWIVTDLGCLGGALMIAMLPLCSSFTVVSDMLSYKGPDFLLLRSQNTSCGFQQQEAGVTPEARKDRAAISRRDGVTPASDRVLAALRFLAVSVASACLFCLLSPCQGDAGGEISWERCFLGTFHGYVHWLMRVPFEQCRLSVHGC